MSSTNSQRQREPVPSRPGEPEVTFEHDLDKKYVCPVCLSYLKDPMQTPCGHRFCKDCIQRVFRLPNSYVKCPVDNQYFKVTTQLFEDNAVKREILSLPVRCDHYNRDCTWKGELRELPMHKLSCKQRLVPCSHCDSDIPFVDITKHQVLKCPKFPVLCLSCGEVGIQRRDMTEHQNHCPDAQITCQFQTSGCQYETKRKLMNDHYQDMCHSHLSLVVERLNKQDSLIDGLRTEVNQLKNFVNAP